MEKDTQKLLERLVKAQEYTNRLLEASLPSGVAEQARMSRLPEDSPPQSAGERARQRIAGLRSKGG